MKFDILALPLLVTLSACRRCNSFVIQGCQDRNPSAVMHPKPRNPFTSITTTITGTTNLYAADSPDNLEDENKDEEDNYVPSTNSEKGTDGEEVSDKVEDDDDGISVTEGLASAVVADTTAETTTSDATAVTTTELLKLAAATGRGEFATEEQKSRALGYIEELEASNPTEMPTSLSSSAAGDNQQQIQGRWELVYSSTQLFRSSPFFMAGRAVCTTTEQAKQYDWFCDLHRAALAISNIGTVRQIVTPTQLISEFEVKVGSVPFLPDATKKLLTYSGGWPVTIDGAIVSTADLTPTNDGTGWELYMDTVEIKGSNIPLLRAVLDGGVKLSSRSLADVLERTISTYTTPRPIFQTTYLSSDLRISRDQDDKVFVYVKESDDTSLTDYSSVPSDLGIGKLWQGFQKTILQQ